MDFKADVMVFSEAAHEDFGATSAAEDLRVRALSHSSGCIHRLKRGKLTELAMKIPQSCEVLTHLYFYPAHTELYLCDEYAFLNRVRNRALFRVRFPHSGYYAFKIYARARQSDGPWPNVFNYVIEVLEADDVTVPFPIPVECYDLEEGFELREPDVRYLPSHTKVFFNLWVPGAKSVVAINGGKRTGLVRDGGASDTWTADVRTHRPGSELRIAAQFIEGGGEAKLLTILLLYEVVHAQRKEEEAVSGGAINSKHATPRSHKSKSEESEKSRQQGTSLEDENRSSTKSQPRSSVKEQTENKSKNKTQKIFAIAEDERMRKLAQKQETDDVRAELLESIRSRKLDRLHGSISVIHKLRLSAELEKELKVALNTVEGLQRLENLRDAILLLDATALAEVRRYSQPPPLVHDIMVAVLLLLGHDEGQTRKWSNCQKLCNTLGRSGLKKKIQEFDLESVHPEILERSWQIIRDVNVSDVVQISQGASSFYSWVAGLYEEYIEMHRNQDAPQPANRKRQKEILSVANHR